MIRLLVILALNFGALYIGALFMGGSPADNVWYQSLNKAPWTPPGWVFGAAWTTIMVCYAFYVHHVLSQGESRQRNLVIVSYVIQLFLNVVWNPLFFNWELPWIALIFLFSLFLLVGWQLFRLSTKNAYQKFLIMPYLLWLMIALSLNLFVVLNNPV